MEKLDKWLLFHLPSRMALKFTSFLMKKQGQGKTEIVREYYKQRYKTDIGLYTYGGCFNTNCNVGGRVSIGKYCSIAENVHYFGANHPMTYVSMSAYFYNRSFGYDVTDVPRETLKIGHDVWIGYGVLIMSSCHSIGNGAVIGAGSIVTHNVPPYAVVAGNPAKIIKYRFTDEEQKHLEQSRWWELPPEEIMKHYKDIDNILNFTENIS